MPKNIQGKNKIKAVILAAGESSRFRPISHDRHKSLTKIAGKELVRHTAESVLKNGVEEVIIIHSPEDYKYFNDVATELKGKVKLIVQMKPEGMGNALKCASHLLRDGQFFVLNPDKPDAGEYVKIMLNKAKKEKAEMVLLATKTAHPHRYGIAKFDVKDPERVIAIHEKPEKGKEPSNMRIIGVYLLPHNFMDYYNRVQEHHYSFEDALHLWMKENDCRVVNTDKEPISCKYAFDLLDMAKAITTDIKPYISKSAKIAKSATIEGNVHIDDETRIFENAVIKGPVYIGKKCVIGNNALVRENSVLEDGVTVGMNTEVTRSVILENTHIHSGFIGDSVIGKNCKIGANFITANRRLDRDGVPFTVKGEKINSKKTFLGCVVGHNTSLGINVSTMPGTIIGYNCVVGPGAQAKGTIDPNILLVSEGKHIQKQRTIQEEAIPSVFQTMDFRGKYPSELSDAFAERLGRAVGSYLKEKGTIIVGNDTRAHSENLKRSLMKGLIESNINVIDTKIATTDKVALATNYNNASLGIMVTASHNAWDESGFKFLYTKGNGFSLEDMQIIKDFYIKNKPVFGMGRFDERSEETTNDYDKKIIEAFKKYSGKNKISGKFVIDTSNGGASISLPNILKRLGAQVIEVNCSTEIDESIEPEPKEENRAYLLAELKKNRADMILGTDPDGDRVFAYDNKGNWINGDDLFGILAKICKAKNIIASIDTSKKVGEYTKAKMEITKVGDIHLAEKAIEKDADFAGEPNGHYLFPKFAWYNSGTFSAVMLASIANKIPDMVKEMPKYSVERKAYKIQNNSVKEEKMKHVINSVNKKYRIISDLDGIKFEYKNSEVLIRSSNTEPKIRMSVENRSNKMTKRHFMELEKEFFSLGYMSNIN